MITKPHFKDTIMKVYRVSMRYSNGQGTYGLYQSPLFKNIEDAEAFKVAILTTNDLSKKWISVNKAYEQGCFSEEIFIDELEIITTWNGELKDAKKYLDILFILEDSYKEQDEDE